MSSTNQINQSTARENRFRNSSIVQNFLLVWLDENINETENEDYRNTTRKFQRIVHTVKKFDNIDECIHFLTQIKDEKIFLIVSDTLGQQILPRIHHISQLDSVYVLCRNISKHKQWTKEWFKVKGIYTHITPICEFLKQSAQQCDRNSILITFISTNNQTETQVSDQTFMYTQIFKEILFEFKYNEDSIRDFVTYCRNNNYGYLNTIDKFKREYHLKTPIWWYTYPSFLCSMLNRALRTLEMDTLIKLGFFICDLIREIKQLHTEQLRSQYKSSFTVYRGQGLSKIDFSKLMKTKGGFISFNNFLSTSIDRNVSYTYADSNQNDPQMIGVLFQMTIDPSILSTPFAWTGNVSYFNDQEQEILFSMHTLFRVIDIKSIGTNNRLWEVELKLAKDTDYGLYALTNKIRTEIQGSPGWDRLGQLLLKLGQFNKAEEVYQILLNSILNENEKAHLYIQIGKAKNGQENYVDAILFYQKALKILQSIIPTNQSSLACCYNIIGQVYQWIGDYPKALSSYQKALNIEQNIFPSDHLDLAKSFEHIGILYNKSGEYGKALLSHRKSLEIRQKNLPINHPTLAHSCQNMGLVYNNMGEYSIALFFYKEAHAIMQQTLPSNHPFLANSYNSIGLVYNNMGRYFAALLEYKKGLEIYRTTFPLDRPNLVNSYNNIAVVYTNAGEYTNALESYKKALQVYEKILPRNNSARATSWNGIGFVYYKTGNYFEALSYYEKAIQVYPNNPSINDPFLANLYTNIGIVYTTIGEYFKALSSYENALKINQKIFLSNNPAIVTSYSNIAFVYFKMGKYSNAFTFYKRALLIAQDTLPASHPLIREYCEKLNFLKEKC